MKQIVVPNPHLPQALFACTGCSFDQCDKKKECCKKYKNKGGAHCKKCPKR